MQPTLLEIYSNVAITYIIFLAIALVVFYYIIKGAVKQGTIEAHNELNKRGQTRGITRSVEKTANPEQEKLKLKYDKGEINFIEFKKEWERLE